MSRRDQTPNLTQLNWTEWSECPTAWLSWVGLGALITALQETVHRPIYRIIHRTSLISECSSSTRSTFLNTERHRRIWPMNSSSPRISGSEPAYDRRWPRHCRSAVHGCRLSATELFLSPLPAPGTTCRAASRPHHLCLYSEAVWTRTYSGLLSRNFCSVPTKFLLSLLTL